MAKKTQKKNWLPEIGDNIKNHRTLETNFLQRSDKNLAIAHSNVYYFGEEMKFWITPSENLGSFGVNRNVVGDFVGTMVNGRTTITDDGKAIYKNSKMGELLITKHNGKHRIQTPLGLQEIEIYNFTSYIPNHNNADATDILINIGSSKTRSYQSLQLLYDEIESEKLNIRLKLDQVELEGLTKRQYLEQLVQEDTLRKIELEKEKLRLTEQLQDLKDKIKTEYANSRSFIRKHAELRHQPILDKWQEEIKRSHLFKGAMAINGGPGTGKTTALIQRIKFLTDKTAMLGSGLLNLENSLEEGYFPKMSITQKELLFGSNNWLFLSPSELLKLFLKNSMIKEGLKADDSRVWVWKDFKSLLIKKYKFINSETRNPFLILNQYQLEILLPSDSKNLKKTIDDFERYFIQSICSTFDKVAKSKTNTFFWHDTVLLFKKDLNEHKKINSITDLIRFFYRLESNYQDSFLSLNKEYLSILNDLAIESLILLKKSKDWYNLELYFSEWQKNQNNNQEEEIEDEDIEEELIINIDHFALQQIKSLIRKKLLFKYDGKQTISKNQEFLLSQLITSFDFETHEKFNKAAELSYFSKYFVKYTRGLVSNVFSRIPQLYKNYRRKESLDKNTKWNREILAIIINDQNKRIHPNEQAFLIYFANKLIIESRKINKSRLEQLNHPYVEAFLEIACPVIGVDEATDFHLIDLLAMESLKHPEISSVTYSGDLMQRLTKEGIRKWEELRPFIKDFKINELKISYRQSPTLLGVANQIYEKAIGKTSFYESFADKDSLEPVPLFFEKDDENEKIEWLAERIVEIYQSYGNMIPSIAIFLTPNTDLKQFSSILGQLDLLCDIGINVVACENGQILGDRNSVRVFSIDFVKGLEFEAAFFHNIDHLFEGKKINKAEEDLLLKNIYVGLSRAAFYLGITCTDSERIGFIADCFSKDKLSWSSK